MKKINISSLKAHLSSSLRTVKEGSRILIMERNTPIAEIIPCCKNINLNIREPVSSLKIPVSNIKIGFDPVKSLEEDINKRQAYYEQR